MSRNPKHEAKGMFVSDVSQDERDEEANGDELELALRAANVLGALAAQPARTEIHKRRQRGDGWMGGRVDGWMDGWMDGWQEEGEEEERERGSEDATASHALSISEPKKRLAPES
eukprot:3423310-Rhodomonas_salina.1